MAANAADARRELDAEVHVDDARVSVVREWPVVIKLKHPVTFGSDTIDALTFRRGRMGDLKGMRIDGVPPANDIMLIASRLCGQPLKVIESLEDEDAGPVVEIAVGFFARCLEAGKPA